MSAVLVTGVSRSRGIAVAVAERLLRDGFRVASAGWTPYDREIHAGIDEQAHSDLQGDLGIQPNPHACSRPPSKRSA